MGVKNHKLLGTYMSWLRMQRSSLFVVPFLVWNVMAPVSYAQDDAGDPIEQPPPPPSDEPEIPIDDGASDANGGMASPSANSTVQKASPNADGPKGASAVPDGQELVNMEFPEATEIKDIIKAVSLWTGKNVILDRQVTGKIQLIAPNKVTKVEAYQMFLSALNTLQFTTVETGKVIKILPIRKAVKGNLKTFMGSNWTPLTDEIITQIVPLKYIDANKIKTTLSRIVPANSIIAYPETNTLIISDTGYLVRRVLDIIELLDVQEQQPQVAMVPIKYSDAKSVSDKISQIFKAGGKGGSYNSYKIFVDERANSVVIFGPPRTIKDVKELVKKFDIQLDDPSRQASIHVRPLDYADAKKLAGTLSTLASGGASKSTIRRPPVMRSPMGGGMDSANDPAALAELSEGVKITADDSSNALLITGSRAAYNALNNIIRKLDIRKSQVYIEADILDINTGNGFKFGTSIFGGYGSETGSKQIIGWEAAGMAPLALAAGTKSTTGTTAGVNSDTAAKLASSIGEDLTIGVLSGTSIKVGDLTFTPGALINALKSDDNTRILSSPHILTANNEESSFEAGETILFPSSTQNPTTGVPVQKTEKEDVLFSLAIKPNISHSNYITMKIDISADSLGGYDEKFNTPRINKRKSKQVVTVKSGQTVVISGLTRNTDIESYSKIPLLGDIPILGWLFRNSVLKSQQSNLVIFLTPHVIHGADDLAAVYKDKVKERDDFLTQVYGNSVLDSDFYARLPKQKDGEYKPSPIDTKEKAKLEQLRKEAYKDMGYGEGEDGAATHAKPKQNTVSKIDETPLTVPGATVGGGDSSFNGGDMPPPMDDGGGMDGGGNEPPPPPPPPMENNDMDSGGDF